MSRVVAAARRWLGTPYHHQAALRGAGCDCLGLVRGVYAELVGPPPVPPPYTRDQAEAGTGEALLAGLARHLAPVRAPLPGDVLVFRLRTHALAKHCAILSEAGCMIHAMESVGVVEAALSPWWHRRIAAVYRFPAMETLT